MSKSKVIRDPETVAVLENLPDGSDHPGVLRKQDGAMVHYWRDGRKVRCREVSKTEACDILFGINDWHERQRAATSDPFVAGVVQHLVETFGDTSSAMMDELAGPAPDLFSHEVATRAHILSAAGAGIKGQWEAFDRTLAAPECPKCGRRMNRQGDRVKIFTTMVGKVRVKRRYYRCPDCGEGFCPFDRQLRLVDKNCTPGAEYLMLKVAAAQGFDKASETLQELSGVKLPASTLHRKVAALGKEIIEFEENELVEGQPQADTLYVGVDGTGVPIIRQELEGRSGKQEDGSARTRECKLATVWTATQRNRKTGRPQKDKGSGLTSARIDSAANPGAGKASQTASRLYRLYRRAGVFLARHVVFISDGADWIRTVNEELLDSSKVTYILDLYHVLEYLCDAVKAIAPDRQRRQELAGHYQSLLRKGRVRQVIEELSPHRHDHEAVEACCRYFTNNVDRMKYDRYTAHGLQTGSGAVEGACKHLVATRMKKTGARWSKMGADAVLAARCLIHNNEFVDYLDWRSAKSAA